MAETFLIKKTAYNALSTVLTDRTDFSFLIGPGELNGTGGQARSSELRLYGLGSLKWGEGVNENLLRLNENYACPQKAVLGSPPVPIPKDESDLGIGNGINVPNLGQEWYNTTDNEMYMYTATGWKRISSTATSSLDTHKLDFGLHLTTDQNAYLDGLSLPTLTSTETNQLIGVDISQTIQTQLDNKISNQGDSMEGNKITSLGDATVGTDALNLQTAEGLYVNATGDTMTGNLNFTGSTSISGFSLDILASTATFTGSISTDRDVLIGDDIIFNDNSAVSRIYSADPNGSTDTFIELEDSGTTRNIRFRTGGDLGLEIEGNQSSALRVSIRTDLQIDANKDVDMGSNRVRNVSTPTTATDAANQQYVNDQITAIPPTVAPGFQHFSSHNASLGGYITIGNGIAAQYLIIAHGITNNRGNGNVALQAPRLVDLAGTILASSGSNRTINWPDGNAPASGIFRYLVTAPITVRILLDGGVTAHYIAAIRLDHL